MRLVTPHMDPGRWDGIEGAPNCVGKDITVERFIELNSPARRQTLRWTSEINAFPEEREVLATVNGLWLLYGGTGYIAVLAPVKIPDDCFGLLAPRSTLLRLGIMMCPSAVWDPGYEGAGRALMMPTLTIQLEPGIPMFSLLLYQAEGLQRYAGAYQGEGL